MDLKLIYSDSILAHSRNPHNRKSLQDAIRLEGANPSCGDEITLHLQVENGIVKSGSYTGVGCAISQASADIMIDLIIGRSKEEALHLTDLFKRMIAGEITDDELEELEEAGALQNISKMPARVKCAVLAWKTLELLLHENG